MNPFFAEDRIETLHTNALKDAFQGEREMVAERMRAAIKAGVKFAVGTDGLHGGMAQEMQTIIDVGASAKEVLAAATQNGPKVCGLEDSVGTLEPIKLADIIGVKGNPLEDIRALEKVETIIQGGVIIKGVSDEG